jgi:hypothetical protein
VTDTRDFPLADVLSVTTGCMLSDHVDGLYRILNHLTGDSPVTHQLGRAAEACRPGVIEQHPQLAGVVPPEGIDVPEVMAWIAEQERVHGDSLVLAPISGWLHVDPIEELVDRVGSERVIVVELP